MYYQFIFQTLKNSPAVASLLGSKIYPQVAPQGVTAPYATYNLVSTTPDRCKAETAQDAHRVQISVFAAGYTEAHAIYKAIRDALDRQKTDTVRCDFENAVDLPYDGDDLLRHIAIDFQLITR